MAFTPVYGNASVNLVVYLLSLQRIALYGIIFKSANKKGLTNDSGK